MKPFYLAGDWKKSPEFTGVINPYDDQVIEQVCLAGAQDVELAIKAAVALFPEVKKLEPYQKERILDTVLQGLSERSDEIVKTIALEVGKPWKHARAELERAIVTFTLARNACFNQDGNFMTLGLEARAHGKKAVVKKFPIGPIAAIAPFNFPVNLVAHKIAPAMAAGCPVILKPATKTPLTALILADIIDKAGWPKGALSVLPCKREVGELLVTDERIKLLSFTGSPAVGWKLKEKSGKKRVVLELGGNAAVYVHADADIPVAAKLCVMSAFGASGQSCISTQRIYVHSSCYDAFKALLLEETRNLKCGNPMNQDTDIGPMITAHDATRIIEWVNQAVSAGAQVLAGGKEIDHHIVVPTLIENATNEMKVSCVEVFGPVATLQKVSTLEEGIAAINHSMYGLQAGVFTRQLDLAWKAFEELEVGGVIINDVPSFRVDKMPYGGIKESGFGREGIEYAISDMTEYKIMVF